jgi:DNA-binding NarL/FixJ family response regulator
MRPACLNGRFLLYETTVVGRVDDLENRGTIVGPKGGEFLLTNFRPTVVFADDNIRVTEAACALLSSAYEIVRVASDGEEAVRWIRELEPDFAVLDISMPKIDGITVARKLKQSGSSTRVVFVTVIDDEDYMQEARLVGHGYVLKHRLALDLFIALAWARDGSFFCSR